MPLPNTVVIGPNWAAHHRPVATGAMTATCALRRPGVTGGTFNPATGAKGGTAHDPYLTGAPARIDAQAEPGQVQDVGQQQVTTLVYRVAVDWTTAGAIDPQPDDLLDVLTVDDNASPTMVGRTLTVKSVADGSVAWERVLICVDDEG